jgi:hypothetical protein
MTTKENTISKLTAAVGIAAIATLGSVTPSLATNSNDGGPFVYEAGAATGSVRSYDRDYAASASAAAPGHRARTPAQGSSRGAQRADDPPGSAFQSWGNAGSQSR